MINVNDNMERIPVTATNDEFCVVLDVSDLSLTDEQFFRLCRDNDNLRFEMTSEGELIIMSPTKPRTGRRNAIITKRLGIWAEQDGSGEVFDSSSIFTLPSGAKRSPDASWILKTRWNVMSEEEQDSVPICPDFVIELRSASDRVKSLGAKMEEYLANGCRLGWLIDPIENRAYIHRPGEPVERIDKPQILSGDPVLPGFRFTFTEIL